MDAEPVIHREEAVGLLFAVSDILEEVRAIRDFLEDEEKRKRTRRTRAERDAWNAHVDETVRRLRRLAEEGWAEIERKRAAGGAKS